MDTMQERVPSRSTHEATACRLAGRSQDAIDDSWFVLARSDEERREEKSRDDVTSPPERDDEPLSNRKHGVFL